MAKVEVSERKRISIPKIDKSSLEWWDSQRDPGLSIRMLIRAEIERNGMADVVNAPVTQQPRRGRPAAQVEAFDETSDATPATVQVSAPAASETAAEVHSEPEAPRELQLVSARPVPVASDAGLSPIDSIMNG